MTLSQFWHHYRVRLGVRLGVLVGLVGGAVGLALRGDGAGWAGAGLLGIGACVAALRIVRLAERPARDLRRFLEGVRYDDMSVHFQTGSKDPFLGALGEAFEAVGEAFRDVRAEREEQASYLEAVVRHVGVALVAFRTDGTVTLFNLAAGRTLNVPRPRTLDTLADRAPEAAQALRRIPPGDRTLIRLDADSGPQELVAYATKFSVAGEAHTLVSLQDIRQELETRELEAWQQLTRVLTHEITNSVAPIASLAGTARGLVDAGDREADVREALATIEKRSRGLVAFVDSYRTLARLPAPEARVTLAADLLGGVATLMRASAPGVHIAVDVTPERLEVVADPDLVEQALVNLVLNAVEALDEQPDGRVVLRAYAGTGGRAVIEVEDNGPGLLPEVRERVFVPFFSTKAGGSGIGLSLSHRIARLHGGTLTVASEPDEQTVFTMRL